MLKKGNVRVVEAGNNRICFTRNSGTTTITVYCNHSREEWDAKPAGKCLMGDPSLPPMSYCVMGTSI